MSDSYLAGCQSGVFNASKLCHEVSASGPCATVYPKDANISTTSSITVVRTCFLEPFLENQSTVISGFSAFSFSIKNDFSKSVLKFSSFMETLSANCFNKEPYFFLSSLLKLASFARSSERTEPLPK